MTKEKQFNEDSRFQFNTSRETKSLAETDQLLSQRKCSYGAILLVRLTHCVGGGEFIDLS